jgi:hypothetical protein|tara:strand:+ start:121 stop:246 length:126 start_codon:yes stop_codon:yes gene_type:complete
MLPVVIPVVLMNIVIIWPVNLGITSILDNKPKTKKQKNKLI